MASPLPPAIAWLALLAAICLVELLGGRRVPENPSRAGSLTDQMMTLATAVVLLAGPLARLVAPTIVIRPAWLTVAVGVLIACGGLALRAAAMRTLGRGYLLHLHVGREGRLVSEGPYRVVRHPGYVGILLQLLGLQVVTGSPIAVAAILLVIVVLPIRVAVEENMLGLQWGRAYEEYRRSTPYRLLPGVF